MGHPNFWTLRKYSTVAFYFIAFNLQKQLWNELFFAWGIFTEVFLLVRWNFLQVSMAFFHRSNHFDSTFVHRLSFVWRAGNRRSRSNICLSKSKIHHNIFFQLMFSRRGIQGKSSFFLQISVNFVFNKNTFSGGNESLAHSLGCGHCRKIRCV